ncbi:MAG: trigger factor [Anaerolineaceae bacterium]|nr:trigger factor [Anaerolineaceae bacterium]
MEVQTERLDAQQARLTVTIENERLETAKKAAARRLAKRNDIRGFRKGKAPYPIVLRHFGEAAIIDEAVDELGNEVYREALTDTDLAVYGPGRLEDFDLQPTPKFTFALDLQPEVELNDYRSITKEYEEPEVSDEDLSQQLKALQYQNAVFEESSQAIVNGNRVSLDFHGAFADEPKTSSTSAEDSEENVEPLPKGSDFARGDDQSFWLDADEEPVLPGFREALLGSQVEDEISFTLVIPQEERFRTELQERTVDFRVKVRKIENVTLPEMNDAFAMNLTKDEEEPLTLLQLRQRLRENLQNQASEQSRMNYIRSIQDEIINQATVRYPDSMIHDEVRARIQQFSVDLNQRYNLKLEDYLRIQGIQESDLAEEFRPEALRNLETWLVRDAIRSEEEITISPDQIDEEMERILAGIGDGLDGQRRESYDHPDVRNRIANGLLQQKIDERLFDIGRGLAVDSTNETGTDSAREDTQENS